MKKFQTICLIILLAIVATMADKTICQIYNANQQKHLYPLSTTITEIKNDTVTAVIFIPKNRRGKANDCKRNQIQKKGKKGIIKDSYVTSGINSWLHPHCNYV